MDKTQVAFRWEEKKPPQNLQPNRISLEPEGPQSNFDGFWMRPGCRTHESVRK